MDGDDAFFSLVKTVLKQAMGAPPAVHSEIMHSMNRLYQAVPTWMMTFGAAHNPGCSALSGLETFKVEMLYICWSSPTIQIPPHDSALLCLFMQSCLMLVTSENDKLLQASVNVIQTVLTKLACGYSDYTCKSLLTY